MKGITISLLGTVLPLVLGFAAGGILAGTAVYLIGRRKLRRSGKAAESWKAQAGDHKRDREELEDLFDMIPAAIWVEDSSALQARLRELKDQGVTRWEEYLQDHPALVRQAADMIRVQRVNRETCRHMGVTSPEALLGPLSRIASEGNYPLIRREILAMVDSQTFLTERMPGVEIPGQGVRDFLASIFLPRLTDLSGKMVVILQDITAWQQTERKLKKTVTEKELLVREIHHRVKNNLQVISSILSMQAQVLDDPAVREPLENCRNRVESMAMLHQLLFQREGDGSLDMAQYLETLLSYMEKGSGGKGGVVLQKRLQSLEVSVEKAVSGGLAAVEIINNAYKHAFPPGEEGTISVVLEEASPDSGFQCSLEMGDDGRGFPPASAEAGGRLGTKLIEALVDQMEGRYTCRSDEKGTVYRIWF